MPSVRVNRQLRSLEEPKTKPMPPATLQVSEPTLAPDRPVAWGVPGVAGVWENAEVAAPTSKVAAPAAARTDRSMNILLCVSRQTRPEITRPTLPRLHKLADFPLAACDHAGAPVG